MKLCRLIVTSQCNLKCEYCLMKDKALISTYQPMGVAAFMDKIEDYDKFLITGGEPTMLCSEKLLGIVSLVSRYGAKTFLYTNGIELYNYPEIIKERLFKILAGINISIHSLDHINFLLLDELQDYAISVRLHIRDVFYQTYPVLFENLADAYGANIKLWTKDVYTCDSSEDRIQLLY